MKVKPKINIKIIILLTFNVYYSENAIIVFNANILTKIKNSIVFVLNYLFNLLFSYISP